MTAPLLFKPNRWLREVGAGSPVFTFGKHTGKTAAHVRAAAPDYLDWMLGVGRYGGVGPGVSQLPADVRLFLLRVLNIVGKPSDIDEPENPALVTDRVEYNRLVGLKVMARTMGDEARKANAARTAEELAVEKARKDLAALAEEKRIVELRKSKLLW